MKTIVTVLSAISIAVIIFFGGRAASRHFPLPKEHHVTSTERPLAPVSESTRTGAVLVTEDLFLDGFMSEPLLEALFATDVEIYVASKAQGSLPSAKTFVAGISSRLAAASAQLARVTMLAIPYDTIWLRDYAPFMSRRAPGPSLVFTDFAAPGENRLNDEFPVRLGRLLGIETRTSPAFAEGGNFLTNGRLCLMSEPEPDQADVAILPAGASRQPPAAAAELKQLVGCERVITIEEPPHAHVDMYVQLIGRDTALVSELPKMVLDHVYQAGAEVPLEYLELKQSLDRIARKLAADFTVERVPMPLPYRGTFRTYTNSLIINDHVIVPSYERLGWNYDDYPDHALRGAMEAEVRRVYERHGLTASFVRADGLIFNGGAFHCAMVQLPQKATTIARKKRKPSSPPSL